MSTSEIQTEIARLESGRMDWDTVQALACLYVIKDHMNSSPIDLKVSSPLSQLVYGKDSDKVWDVIADLFETIKVIQPKLYDAVIKQIEAIE